MFFHLLDLGQFLKCQVKKKVNALTKRLPLKRSQEPRLAESDVRKIMDQCHAAGRHMAIAVDKGAGWLEVPATRFAFRGPVRLKLNFP